MFKYVSTLVFKQKLTVASALYPTALYKFIVSVLSFLICKLNFLTASLNEFDFSKTQQLHSEALPNNLKEIANNIIRSITKILTNCARTAREGN